MNTTHETTLNDHEVDWLNTLDSLRIDEALKRDPENTALLSMAILCQLRDLDREKAEILIRRYEPYAALEFAANL